ncbi:IclR family transcriptional regulator [Variovorax sp. PBL-E5]|uniref:IclR family transcriptional regulator n=1 Tax=Variovorax sp. PBL-E5 TaxID=434014 RepID=UPI001317F343|nr:IclR family transcriptional regulator [Variovorax sp. PBL-E5]VTU45991.1 Pectin degradation repressor protein KdgR [Variovorax sp. PBL-E5]
MDTPDAPDAAAEDKDRQFATSLARGLDVLRCFSARQPVLGNGEIAEITGLYKSTVSRLTYTLTQLGYLRKVADSAKYELGPAVVSLAYPLVASIQIYRVAVPQMRELADYARGWVSIGVRERTNIVYMETVSFDAQALSKRDIGLTFPIISSAIGHAYLAALDEGERTKLLNQIRLKTPQDWTRYSQGAADALAEFAHRGFCLRRGGYNPDVHTVAVPLRLQDETVVFNCAVPARSLSPGQLEMDIGLRLVELVRSVHERLSSDPEAA